MAAFIPALRGLQSRGREPLLWVLTFLFALRVVVGLAGYVLTLGCYRTETLQKP